MNKRRRPQRGRQVSIKERKKELKETKVHPIGLVLSLIIIVTISYFAYPEINLFLGAEKVSAKYIACDEKSNSRDLEWNRSHYISYGRMAQTSKGEIAKGLAVLLDKDLCNKKMGNEVSVLINKNNKNHKILTFLNFWIFLYIGAYILVLMIWALIFGKVSFILNILLLSGGFGLGYMDIYL